ncbi:hypothetical protein HOY80DRAFT_377278 [Tuber brumale]|nr:hypothetical protein HOY80DRAFT_377278 [Tuber brumale]
MMTGTRLLSKATWYLRAYQVMVQCVLYVCAFSHRPSAELCLRTSRAELRSSGTFLRVRRCYHETPHMCTVLHEVNMNSIEDCGVVYSTVHQHEGHPVRDSHWIIRGFPVHTAHRLCGRNVRPLFVPPSPPSLTLYLTVIMISLTPKAYLHIIHFNLPA